MGHVDAGLQGRVEHAGAWPGLDLAAVDGQLDRLPLAHCAIPRGTALVVDVRPVVVGEELEAAQDRRAGRLAKTADAAGLHGLSQLEQKLHVLGLAPALGDVVQDVGQLVGPFPADHALAARLLPQIGHGVPGHLHGAARRAEHLDGWPSP